jgi:hypothetical protein
VKMLWAVHRTNRNWFLRSLLHNILTLRGLQSDCFTIVAYGIKVTKY